MLFREEKEWILDTCYNLDESQKHYVRGRKAAAKGNILYDSVDIRYPERASLPRQKADLWWPRAGRED